MAKLGEAATYINGYAFKPEDWSDKGRPIIRIQNLTGSSDTINRYDGEIASKYEINDGDVLISWSASLGVYVWHGEQAVLNQHIFKVTFDKEDVSKKFFVYQVESVLEKAANEAHGATMKHLTKKVFDNLPFYLPSREEQEKIASKLEQVSKLIECRKLQLEKLDELVKSRFVEMFGAPVLNPKEWDVVKIGDIATEVKYGTSLPAVEGGKYPYLRMNNMTNDGHLDLSNLKYIDVPDDEIEKCIVRKGDVLFNRTNSVELVGKTCVFDLDEEMIIAGYIIRVRLHEAMLPIVFSSYMNTVVIKQYLRKIAKGAVNQANINAKELQAIQIYLPPLDLQNQFADFVAQVDKSKFMGCNRYRIIKQPL